VGERHLIHGMTSASNNSNALHIAIRATRIMGLASAALGLVFIIGYGYFNKYQLFRPIFIAGGMLVWFVPGILLYTCAIFLEKRHRARAAAIGASLIAFTQLLFATTALYLQLFHLTPISPIPVLLSILWCAALVDLMSRLNRASPAMVDDPDSHRGFEVTAPPVPAIPVENSPDQRIDSSREK
jgi:hypothetical protein